jgi:hypothetical protein
MVSDVTCRQYGTEAGDYQTVAAWYAHHRGGEVFPEMVLPPHGVIASVDGTPTAALWVYLSYGIGVAHVHWAVGRPGAGLRGLVTAFGAAIAWVEDVCRSHDCHLIFANCLPKVGRHLPRLGFKPCFEQVFTYKVLP